MSKTIIAVRHFGLGGRESLETAVSSWPHGLENLHRFLEHINSLHPSIKFTLEMQKEYKTIPFLDVLLVIQEDGSLGHKVYRKPTHRQVSAL